MVRKEQRKAYRDTHRVEIKAYNRAYHLAHQEERNAYSRGYSHAYRLAHPEEQMSYHRAYHLAHRQERKAYYLAHPDQVKAYNRKYYLAHREQINAKIRAYAQAHPEGRRARARKRRALQLGVPRQPYKVSEIIARDRGMCGICHRRVAKAEFSIDHILPISLGGADAPHNVQLAHLQCNSRKQNSARFPTQLRLAMS